MPRGRKKTLKEIKYDGGGINYNPRWLRPRCPFCFSDIPKPEPWCWESDGNLEDFDTGETVPAGTKIHGGYEGFKEAQTFIYHNYSVDAHAFSDYWIDMVNVFKPDWNLFHLWFVWVRDGKYDLDTKPRQSYETEKEIKEVIKILDSTKGAFKSKKVQEARERLEKLLA